MTRTVAVFVAAFLTLAPASPASAGSAAQGTRESFQVHPSTQNPSVRVTLATLERWESELSNWGRWGPVRVEMVCSCKATTGFQIGRIRVIPFMPLTAECNACHRTMGMSQAEMDEAALVHVNG